MNSDQLRAQNWYRNGGNYCFGASLANLLLLLDDPRTAEEVYKNYQKYDLRPPCYGILPALSTRAVHDLTNARYQGKLYRGLSGGWSVHYPKDRKLEARLRVICREEVLARRVRLVRKERQYELPVILLTIIEQLEHDGSVKGHASVIADQSCGDRSCPIFIDNGEIVYGSPDVTIPGFGVLEVKKR